MRMARPPSTAPALLCIALVFSTTACSCDDSSIEVGSKRFSIPAAHRQAVAPLSYEPNDADGKLLSLMRERLAQGAVISADDEALRALFEASSFPQTFNRVAVVVYQPQRKRLVVVRRKSGWAGLAATLDRIHHHARYAEFDFANPETTRIQLDFIERAPTPVDVFDLEQGDSGADRFEAGIDGFRVSLDGEARYFLPGDAFVRSIHSDKQLRRRLASMIAEGDLEKAEVKRFISESYVSYGTSWIRLFRGIPIRGEVDRAQVELAARQALEHVLAQMHDDGRFLYYYDSARDSFVDREHPGRDPDKDPYYNILRHSGGGLLLLFDYERTKDPRVLRALKKANDFLVEQIETYDLPDGGRAGYVLYNRKAKLGGSGIALALLAEFQRVTGDETYRPWAEQLKNHLLAEVGGWGEFRYYKIYLDEEVARSENRDYFSFYYPGEAVLGLASYYNHVAAAEEKPLIRAKLKEALRFLIRLRPIVYWHHYASLPSDSWLMMGINEAWNAPELRHQSYEKFVFDDADQMVEHTYTPEDALYPDYPGSFYYGFGDYPYADGARAEGLLAALELAEKVGDPKRVARYGAAVRRVVRATLHLTNTPQALYFADRPEIAVGSIRFKHTRQWVRIDTTQHVAGFYLKLLPSWGLIETD
jgi:hypothetical protein